MKLYRNAKTTPAMRALLVDRIRQQHWSPAVAAAAAGMEGRLANAVLLNKQVRSLHIQDGYGRRGQGWLRPWCVVATVVLMVACGRPVPGRDQSRATGEGVKIEDVVDVHAVDSGLIVQYRTRTSIRDCKAQAAEMPLVWDLVVRPRLKDSAVQQVFLSPEEPSGQSVAMTFTKNASGQWAAAAPCAVRIAADDSTGQKQPGE